MNPLLVALFMVNTLLMPLIVEMIKERAPERALRLIKISVRLLPPAYRDRYLAEWIAELQEMDRQNISQLVASIRILLGASAVARVLRAKDRHRSLAEGMAYLPTSERRVIRVRRHWAMLLTVLMQTMGIVIGAFLLSRLLSSVSDRLWLPQSLLWYVAVAAVVRFAWHVLEWWQEVLIVTDKRFMVTSGIVVRKTSMMPIGKVIDMSFMQPVVGQLLGYGTLLVESAGQIRGLERIEYLPRPEEVVHAISELIFSEQRQN